MGGEKRADFRRAMASTSEDNAPDQGSNLSPHFVSEETATPYNSAPTDPDYNPDTQDGNAPNSADLRAVVDAWPNLPEAIRAGIIAMVKAAGMVSP